MFVRPDNHRVRRDLRAEARARIRRQAAQVRRDAGVLQAPRQVGNSTVYSGRVARDGGMTYLDTSGRPYVETRDADELRRIVDQLVGKPVVLDHPPEGEMMATGSRQKVIGRVVNAYFEDGAPAYAVADVEVTDADARQAIADGQRQLSLGYSVDLDGTRQTNTNVDHVALVRHARCGASCALRTDCGGASGCRCSSCLDKHALFAPRKEQTMSRKPAPDPLTDMAAAEDRARRRDPSATFRSTGESADDAPNTANRTPEPASDDDMTSMDAALMRAFLRQ